MANTMPAQRRGTMCIYADARSNLPDYAASLPADGGNRCSATDECGRRRRRVSAIGRYRHSDSTRECNVNIYIREHGNAPCIPDFTVSDVCTVANAEPYIHIDGYADTDRDPHSHANIYTKSDTYADT